MKLSYEKACIEAGLSEEKIKEIRKVFHDDNQKIYREAKIMEKEDFYCYSLYQESADGEFELDIPDPNGSAEDVYLNGLYMDVLSDILDSYTESEYELLMAYMDKKTNFSEFARSHNMTRKAALYRVEKMIEEIRIRFFERI